MSSSFQAHVTLTTNNGANPTISKAIRCGSITRTGEGTITLTTTEGIATDHADIALSIGLAAGAIVNLVKGVDDFTWTIETFTVAAGAIAADDVAGAVVQLTLGRIDPQ